MCHHSWPIKVGIKQPTAATSPYTTRAAIRPDRRLQTSHPGGSAYASGGHGRKTLLRAPDIEERLEPSEASTQNMREVFARSSLPQLGRASKLLRSYLPPEQHEADGCASPASSTGPRGANCACAVPRLAVSSAKEAAKKWALRAPSRAQRRQRRAHGRPPPTMVKASRSELSNSGLRGPNTKRAPGRPVRP